MNRREFLVGALGGALTARAALAGPRSVDNLLAATVRRVALVTADAASHVAMVDLATGAILRRIPTLAQPRSIESLGSGRALVAHSERGRLTVVDAVAGSARLLSDTMGEPRYTALHPLGRYAYITDSGREEVAVLDLATGRIVWRSPVAGPARHLTVDPSGRWLWTVLGTKDARVAILALDRPERPRVVGRLRMPFAAHDVVAAPGGRRVWVSSGDRGRVAIVDLRSRRVQRMLVADAPPQHIAFAPSGAAYVTSGDDGAIRTYDVSGRLLRRRRVPVGSFNVTELAGTVVSPSLERGTLAVMDRRGLPRRVAAVTSSAHDACILVPARGE